MGLEIRLAWRNLWRNLFRNILLILLIIIVLAFGTYAVAFLNGLSLQRLQDQLDYSLGHLKITHPKFDQAKNVNDFLADTRLIKKVIENGENIEAFSERCNVRALVQKQGKQWAIDLYGVEVQSEKKTLYLFKKIVEGEYLTEKTPHNQVVIGKNLAEKIGARVGDSLQLQLVNREGKIKNQVWQVVGIYAYSQRKFEATHIFVPISRLREALNLPTTAVHQLVIRLKDKNIAERQVLDYQDKWPNLKIQAWQKTAPELAYLDALMESFFWIFNGIILLVLLVAIVNTMLMNVLERQEEFGLLKTLGMNKSRILTLVFWETFFIVCLGGCIGIWLAWGAILHGQNYGVHLSLFAEAWAGWGSSAVVYPILKAYDGLKMIILLIFTAFLATLYPAWLILSKNALELRNK